MPADYHQDGLFDITTAAGTENFYGCQRCDRFSRFGSDEAARVNGWTVYAGSSVTGKKLRAVLCPAHSGTRTSDDHSRRTYRRTSRN